MKKIDLDPRYTELKKMHKYLYSDKPSSYQDKITVSVSPTSIDHIFCKTLEQKEIMEFVYNINSRTLSYHSCDISGHNGDSYNTTYIENIQDILLILGVENIIYNNYKQQCKKKAIIVAKEKKLLSLMERELMESGLKFVIDSK